MTLLQKPSFFIEFLIIIVIILLNFINNVSLLGTCPDNCSCKSVEVWDCNLSNLKKTIDCEFLPPSVATSEIKIHLTSKLTDFTNVKTVFKNTFKCQVTMLNFISPFVFSNLAINNLYHLRYLQMQHSQNSLITSSFDLNNILYKLSNLKIFKLESYVIEKWRRSYLSSCIKVEEIELKSLKLDLIEQDAFSKCFNLKKLTIAYNNLQELFSTSFNNIMTLEYLILSYNNINSLTVHGSKGWTKLNQLKELDLSHNSLKHLSDNSFNNLKSLTHLYLTSNPIEIFSKNAFNNLPNLKELYLNDNEKLLIIDLHTLQPVAQSLSKLDVDLSNVQCIVNKGGAYLYNEKVKHIFFGKPSCSIFKPGAKKEDDVIEVTTQSTTILLMGQFKKIVIVGVTCLILILIVIFLMSYCCIVKRLQKLNNHVMLSAQGTVYEGSHSMSPPSSHMGAYPLNLKLIDQATSPTPNYFPTMDPHCNHSLRTSHWIDDDKYRSVPARINNLDMSMSFI